MLEPVLTITEFDSSTDVEELEVVTKAIPLENGLSMLFYHVLRC
jgi:hypothetical protein